LVYNSIFFLSQKSIQEQYTAIVRNSQKVYYTYVVLIAFVRNIQYNVFEGAFFLHGATMAICRICGYEDERLPKDWANWECWQCFVESFISCIEPADSDQHKAIIADVQQKCDKLNSVLINSKMKLALKEAEK